MADTNFYRAFEDRYRGSREAIKSRLAAYLPFIQPLQQFYPNCQGIDLGCGRGEWLELMQENKINMLGVDLDQGMLAVARERGLNVILGDAIQSLQTLPSESQTLVSGFHIAEHLPFEILQVLIQESMRVLRPGGLLILETPNPENISVGTEKFYLDPSHYRPIPSQFLSFMAEYTGFEKVKVLRLQEPIGLADSTALILLSVLNGVSPDYAVVAQKGGALELTNLMASAFEAEYGLSLERLADSYDRQIKTSIQQVDARAQQAALLADHVATQAHLAATLAQQADAKAQQADAKAQQADAKAQQADAKAQQADAKAQQADVKAQQADVKAQQADVKAQQAEFALIAIHNSSSWRLTAPLRKIGNAAKSIFQLTKSTQSKVQNKITLFLTHALLYLNRRPQFSRIAKFGFTLFPAVKLQVDQATRVTSTTHRSGPFVAIESSELTPRARQIYDGLKEAIENRSKRKN